ncbi:hypothetical protein PR048_001526 [Dryococelus australis]|uniref:CCHC-type domain-containing protein n=1 Tax=Dryococelus australis TaxID=614101 RepID=A0ABQ9IK20_9NEOP|nr:hypothetical protein PR048_001526 [Dryococelus australis]
MHLQERINNKVSALTAKTKPKLYVSKKTVNTKGPKCLNCGKVGHIKKYCPEHSSRDKTKAFIGKKVIVLCSMRGRVQYTLMILWWLLQTKMKDLYVLDTCQESVYMSKGQSTNRMWHDRLAHLNRMGMDLLKKGVAEGI